MSYVRGLLAEQLNGINQNISYFESENEKLAIKQADNASKLQQLKNEREEVLDALEKM